MLYKRGNVGAIVLLLIFCFSTSTVSALTLTINATLNNYSTQFLTETYTNAITGKDGFDFETDTLPNKFTQLHSTVGTYTFSVDVWNESVGIRTINLTHIT